KEQREKLSTLASVSSFGSISSTESIGMNNDYSQVKNSANKQQSADNSSTIKGASQNLGDKDLSNTSRTAATIESEQTKKRDETSLEKLLHSSSCLDEAAITMNFILRRLLCDMFDDSKVFTDALTERAETKLKEIAALAIFDEIKVESMNLGHVYPVILKVEPMQWNTRGIWLNVFLLYHGSIKLTIKTKLLLDQLINYNRGSGEPMFRQHAFSQKVHKEEGTLSEDDIVARQKLLAMEPEVPEMAPTRKLGTLLQNLAENKWFQTLIGFTPIADLFKKLTGTVIGADIEVTDFVGILTVNIPPPPSDRIWVGLPEVPDLNLKVNPIFGKKTFSHPLIQDYLETKIKSELKRIVVLPAMDDQLLPFFRDWVIDVIGEIAEKPVDPVVDKVKVNRNSDEVSTGNNHYKGLNPITNTVPVVPTSPTTNDRKLSEDDLFSVELAKVTAAATTTTAATTATTTTATAATTTAAATTTTTTAATTTTF
ncbi:unnamed protein product, partial [Didymodactylos carnosus]